MKYILFLMFIPAIVFGQIPDDTDGLLRLWHMNEGEGATTTDEISSIINDLNSATWINPAKFDKGINIGTGANITSNANENIFNARTEWSISVWLKLSVNAGGIQCFIDNHDGSDRNIFINPSWANPLDCYMAITTTLGTNSKEMVLNADYFDNNWHLWVFTFKKNDYLSVWVDKVLEDQIATTDHAMATVENKATWGNSQAANWYLNGTMDDLAVWDTCLTESEIEKIYTNDWIVPSTNVVYALILKRSDLSAESLWETGDIITQIQEQNFLGWGSDELDTNKFITTKVTGSSCCYVNCLINGTTILKNREYQVYTSSITAEMNNADFCNSLNKKSIP